MHFFSNQNGPTKRPLHTRRKRFVLRDTHDGPQLFEEYEATYLDDETGVQTTEEMTIYQAGCGHLVGLQSPAELISSCGYCRGKSLCYRCGDLRCRRCLKIVCQDCARIVDDSAVYCPKCKLRVMILRVFTTSMRQMHELLSKDIR